jgi:hypothetical protein
MDRIITYRFVLTVRCISDAKVNDRVIIYRLVLGKGFGTDLRSVEAPSFNKLSEGV